MHNRLMICHLRWPLPGDSECGRVMKLRTTPAGRLFACPVHDGDAANEVLVKPWRDRA